MGGALMIISGLVGLLSVLAALVGFTVELSSGAAVGRSSSRAAGVEEWRVEQLFSGLCSGAGI